jgi:hypothetical protein
MAPAGADTPFSPAIDDRVHRIAGERAAPVDRGDALYQSR